MVHGLDDLWDTNQKQSKFSDFDNCLNHEKAKVEQQQHLVPEYDFHQNHER